MGGASSITKSGWRHHAATAGISSAVTLLSWVFGAGVVSQQGKELEARVKKIEDSGIVETRFQVIENTKQILVLQADNKLSAMTLSDVKSQLAGISAKLDTLNDLMKRQQQHEQGK